MNAEKYTYRVIWSEDDKEYLGLCAEFPSLSWLAGSQGEALAGIVEVVREVLEDMEANNEEIPEPLSLRSYSGNFMVRTTPETHRRLAVSAQEAGVSLNRYINSLL